MGDIYAALAAVMDDCKHVAKRDRNEHQRFLFRGIDAVVNAVGPVLRKHSVVVVPNVEHVSYDTVQTSTGKPTTACRLLVAYSFYAIDGSSVTAQVAAEAWDSGDKAAPKAMSVAFRTALLQALALPTDEPDPDLQTFERAHAETTKPLLDTSGKLAKRMFALFGDAGITDKDLRLAYVSDAVGRVVESSKDMTEAQARAVCAALEAELEVRRQADAPDTYDADPWVAP